MAKMEETLAALSLGEKKSSGDQAKPNKTRPPNPKVKSKKPPMDPDDSSDNEPEPETDDNGELSEAAKKARLRRLCERKSSGKLKVPEEVHEMWLKGGFARDELCKILEESGWEKDRLACFTLE